MKTCSPDRQPGCFDYDTIPSSTENCVNSTQEKQEAQFQFINDCTLKDAALAYAAKGIRVFPLQPNSKLPVPKWPWKKIATTDPAVINDWWSLYPTANIGLAVGEGSGINVLDIDVKNGQDGTRSYQAITQERYPGAVQKTPSGGVHLLFQYTPGLINFTRKGTLGGLDMRTNGGYIVAAPSVVDGGPYHWTQDGDIPDMPGALLVACEQWSHQSTTTVVDAPDIPENLPDINLLTLDDKYLNYLKQGITTAWQDDESRAIYSVAGALMRKLNDSAAVFGIMSDNAFAWACAERHRQFGNPGDWLWKYGISKIVAQAATKDLTEVFQPLAMQPSSETNPDPEGWITWGDKGIEKARFAPDWIIRGLIERGQVGLVYGDSQALKSYLCLDMAAQVARGGSWHGHDVVSPGRVLFIAGEGNQILWRRLEAYRQKNNLHSDELKNLGITCTGMNFMDRGHLEFLKGHLDSMETPPELIIIDTLARNAILDENSAKDISELVNTCDMIAKAYNCSTILVHHMGKSNKTNARGSSALEANTDFRFKMERLEGSQEIRTKLTVQKLKGAPEPLDPIIFEAVTTTLMGVVDDDFAPVTDLALERISLEELPTHIVKNDGKQSRLRGKGLHIMEVAKLAITNNKSPSNPNGARALRSEIYQEYLKKPYKGKIDTDFTNFKRSLNSLVKNNFLTIFEDTGGDAWYSLPHK